MMLCMQGDKEGYCYRQRKTRTQTLRLTYIQTDRDEDTHKDKKGDKDKEIWLDTLNKRGKQRGWRGDEVNRERDKETHLRD